VAANFIDVRQTVVISILNWNSADITLSCIKSVLATTGMADRNIDIVVIDNGSMQHDWDRLQEGIDSDEISVIRQSKNLGFAGGHNIAIKLALMKNADFIWLVNSDAIVEPDTLTKLMAVMISNPSCGAVSPVILSSEGNGEIDFCGGMHNWEMFESISFKTIPDARSMEAKHPKDMWVLGTAPLLRMTSIREVGLLDERLFAYYEDNDICTRLSRADWTSRMAFDATVTHVRPRSQYEERPPYYFYLMARNSIHFWLAHTPKPNRRLIRLKLMDRNILTANRLFSRGLTEKANACLMGVIDGLLGRTGVWILHRRTPVSMRILSKILWYNHVNHLDGK
jgi:GT2 family glycosyltransferase